MGPVSIFNVFGRSPIRPLQEHMAKVHACSHELLPFFDAVMAQDWPRVEEHQVRIAALEKDADHIRNEMRLHLPKSLFLPVPRSDLLEILSVQDKIANKSKDIAGLVLGRHLIIPQTIAPSFKAFLQRSLDATNQAQKAINELDELLETGFVGSEVQHVEEMIQELDRTEHDTDELQITVRHSAYSIEETLSPIDAMFLYKVIELVGELADSAEHVGNCLQLLLAR